MTPNQSPAFTVEDAHRLAREAHSGQVDQQDRDYYEHHLLPVAESLTVYGEHAVMAGLLHDLLEDCPDWTEQRMTETGVPADVVRAVVSVTRQAGEPYEDLIGRACADPLGCLVKLADNTINLLSNPGLAVVDREKAYSLMKGRYLPARDRLVLAAAHHHGADHATH